MADKNPITSMFQNFLGINPEQPRTTSETISNIIGGALFTGGFIGALNANDKMPTFLSATKSTQDQANAILPGFNEEADKAKTALTADLAGYENRAEAGVKQGLINRGLTDPGLGNQAAGQLRQGLSGAYATAQAALAGAKVNAQDSLSGAMSRYQQNVGQQQYKSMLSNYYSKMGIWGALGGIGGSLINTPTKLSAQQELDDQPIDQNPGMPGTDERGGK